MCCYGFESTWSASGRLLERQGTTNQGESIIHRAVPNQLHFCLRAPIFNVRVLPNAQLMDYLYPTRGHKASYFRHDGRRIFSCRCIYVCCKLESIFFRSTLPSEFDMASGSPSLEKADIVLEERANPAPFEEDSLPPEGSDERILAERRLVRKLDMRVLPTIVLIFIMNYIDVNLTQPLLRHSLNPALAKCCDNRKIEGFGTGPSFVRYVCISICVSVVIDFLKFPQIYNTTSFCLFSMYRTVRHKYLRTWYVLIYRRLPSFNAILATPGVELDYKVRVFPCLCTRGSTNRLLVGPHCTLERVLLYGVWLVRWLECVIVAVFSHTTSYTLATDNSIVRGYPRYSPMHWYSRGDSVQLICASFMSTYFHKSAFYPGGELYVEIRNS